MNGYKENNVGNVLMKLNLVKNVLFGLYADHRMRMHPFMVVAVRQAVNSILHFKCAENKRNAIRKWRLMKRLNCTVRVINMNPFRCLTRYFGSHKH